MIQLPMPTKVKVATVFLSFVKKCSPLFLELEQFADVHHSFLSQSVVLQNPHKLTCTLILPSMRMSLDHLWLIFPLPLP